MGPDDLLHHRVAQLLLAGKMVKECSLGQSAFLDDSVQAAALEAEAIELLEGDPKNALPGCFRRVCFVHGNSSYRPVGMLSRPVLHFSGLEAWVVGCCPTKPEDRKYPGGILSIATQRAIETRVPANDPVRPRGGG